MLYIMGRPGPSAWTSFSVSAGAGDGFLRGRKPQTLGFWNFVGTVTSPLLVGYDLADLDG
jgi:hypothetical protein